MSRKKSVSSINSQSSNSIGLLQLPRSSVFSEVGDPSSPSRLSGVGSKGPDLV